jgi:hypothetical protein
MTEAVLADLDSLDKETLKALPTRERRSNAQQIEHLKLVIEKLRRMLFGVKSEKLAGLAHYNRSPGPHRCAVRDRRRNPRQARGDQARSSPVACPAADR